MMFYNGTNTAQYLQYTFHCVHLICSEFLHKCSCPGTRHTDCSRKTVLTSETPLLANQNTSLSTTPL